MPLRTRLQKVHTCTCLVDPIGNVSTASAQTVIYHRVDLFIDLYVVHEVVSDEVSIEWPPIPKSLLELYFGTKSQTRGLFEQVLVIGYPDNWIP